MHDFGDKLFLAVGHDMNAGHAFDFLDLIDDVDADPFAFGLLVLGTFQPLDNGVGNMHARYVRAHPFGRPRRSQRADTAHDETFLVEP